MPIEPVDPVECPSAVAWRLELALPPTWEAGQRLALELVPGWDRSTGEQCLRVEGRTTQGAESSPTAALLSAPDCLPVPEPPTSALLLVGLVALAGHPRIRGRFRAR